MLLQKPGAELYSQNKDLHEHILVGIETPGNLLQHFFFFIISSIYWLPQ